MNIDKSRKQDILDTFEQYINEKTKYHMGYPYNLDYEYKDLQRFLKYSINNLGDPFIESNYGVHSRQFELELLEFFSNLWKIDDYWGYVTNSGTEGNLQGLLIARENFPNGIIYTSKESHYSISKAAHFYRMDIKIIETSWDGCIRLDLLQEEISKNKDKPVIINANIGTTMKGAVDNIYGIIGVLHELSIPRDKFYIHCDGALFAMMLSFMPEKYTFKISFELPIDSISISGHKFLGCPMPCGVIITRKHLMNKLQNHIEYLNSSDTTITGSRNGHASLYIWNVIVDKGISGFKEDVDKTMKNAKYLEKELQKNNISSFRNNLSSTIVFEKPTEEIIKKWQLACIDTICHVVIMPSIDKEKIDIFLQDILEIDYSNKICIKHHINDYCKCSKCSK